MRCQNKFPHHLTYTLAGHINLHKAHPDALQESKIENVQPRSRDPTSAVLTNSASWSPSRPAPYNKGGERAGRVAPNPHRHRTLVLNNKAGNVSSESILSGAKRYESESSRKGQTPVNNWVTKRDRHMQLINSSIYEKETQQRNKGIEETRKQKMIRRDQREKRKIQRHLQTLHPPRIGATSASIAHEMTIQGLRFHVLDGGSKLARIRRKIIDSSRIKLDLLNLEEIDSASATPKHANIGGVSFLRSKNGNMYRSGVVKARKYVFVSCLGAKPDRSAIDIVVGARLHRERSTSLANDSLRPVPFLSPLPLLIRLCDQSKIPSY